MFHHRSVFPKTCETICPTGRPALAPAGAQRDPTDAAEGCFGIERFGGPEPLRTRRTP